MYVEETVSEPAACLPSATAASVEEEGTPGGEALALEPGLTPGIPTGGDDMTALERKKGKDLRGQQVFLRPEEGSAPARLSAVPSDQLQAPCRYSTCLLSTANAANELLWWCFFLKVHRATADLTVQRGVGIKQRTLLFID
uniref:Uncharacterized protein n=1 Tax=Knipowitschia caucasica TaxID=637954 RepID=A0AAV2J0K6_KNICA